MHPSLRLSNFSKLPPSLKTRAISAASGALKETHALHNDLPHVPHRHLLLLLPAFFAPLDPARISAILTRFDSSGWLSIRADVVQAHMCLGAICQLGASMVIPTDAFPDLWRRVWPWIEFLDEYHEPLSGDGLLDGLMDGETQYTAFLSLMRFLHNNVPTGPMTDPPTGMYVVVGRAWRHLLHGEDTLRGMPEVSHFIGLRLNNTTWNSAAFEELVVGAGGTRTDLASMVVSHIKRFLPDGNAVVTEETYSHFMGILPIVASESFTGHRDHAFEDALLSSGIVAALTIASQAVCHSTHPRAGSALKVALPALIHQISSCPPLHLPEALRGGLLDIFFTSENRSAISDALVNLVEQVLSPATVYHSVLTQLRLSLPQIRHRDAAAIFADPTLLARWESLLQTIESRFRILDEYRTGTLTAMRACDDREPAKPMTGGAVDIAKVVPV
ncbi:hypothetical protein C8R45DRAFT_1151310 [Mycena sanguinolenta]|nr:hypothetical protein C8R45DRAFT_1151310 [Mycena sanguinolenta]